MNTKLASILGASLFILIPITWFLAYHGGVDSVQRYPENEYIRIDDNIYLKDSTVEITRCFDMDNKEYLFIEVVSNRGSIMFEKHLPDEILIDEWIISFQDEFLGTWE